MTDIEIKRLSSAEAGLAAATLAVMAAVFEDEGAPPAEAYVEALLARPDLLLFAALRDGRPIGGLTAFMLPLTRAERSELLIYDLAVAVVCQRQGVGRQLVQAALSYAERLGVGTAWIPADDDDGHALEFYRALGGTPTVATIFTFES